MHVTCASIVKHFCFVLWIDIIGEIIFQIDLLEDDLDLDHLRRKRGTNPNDNVSSEPSQEISNLGDFLYPTVSGTPGKSNGQIQEKSHLDDYLYPVEFVTNNIGHGEEKTDNHLLDTSNKYFFHESRTPEEDPRLKNEESVSIVLRTKRSWNEIFPHHTSSNLDCDNIFE